MKMLLFSKVRNAVIAIAFLILAGGLGYQLGLRQFSLSFSSDKKVIINQNPPGQVNVDFSLFWDVWQRLHRYWIDAPKIDTQKMVWGAITGMVNSLEDPYTVFLPPKENEEFKQDLGGEFEGIGAQLGQEENRIIVIAPLEGTPAEKAGLLAGDWILKVNDEETVGWSVAQAVSKIRGPRGTAVTLNILHKNGQKPLDVKIVRDKIEVPSVDWWVKAASDITEISGLPQAGQLVKIPGTVAYLRLSRFGDRTNEEWNRAVADIVIAHRANGNLKGLVLDLRNNPGGYLDGSVFIASEFVKSGTIVSQVNADGTKEDYQVNRQGKLLTISLVVLINKGSASAAEIVAGALRDYKRATLVGETTFGKGSVQIPQDLAGGAGLHITTGKWLLPKGDSINKTGVAPDITVALDTNEASRDAQLAKAIEMLVK